MSPLLYLPLKLPYHHLCTGHSTGHNLLCAGQSSFRVILTVPAIQPIITSTFYQPLNWPYDPLCTGHSTGSVNFSVPAVQLAMSYSLYRPLSCHIILFVPATPLAMSSSLYQPLNWPCHHLCTGRSTGHVILTVSAT